VPRVAPGGWPAGGPIPDRPRWQVGNPRQSIRTGGGPGPCWLRFSRAAARMAGDGRSSGASPGRSPGRGGPWVRFARGSGCRDDFVGRGTIEDGQFVFPGRLPGDKFGRRSLDPTTDEVLGVGVGMGLFRGRVGPIAATRRPSFALFAFAWQRVTPEGRVANSGRDYSLRDGTKPFRGADRDSGQGSGVRRRSVCPPEDDRPPSSVPLAARGR